MSTDGHRDYAGQRQVPDVSVVIVNYNGRATVLGTIASLLDMQGVRADIIVVDDGSTDGSPEAVAREFPGVEVLREAHNTRQVNRLRNRGLHAARTEKVFVTDNDVTFDPRCILEMLRAMQREERVAMCTPRLMYSDDTSLVYMGGARVHFIGATLEANRHKAYDGNPEPRAGVGGGIALFDRKALAEVGGFDEEYELAWGDDIELHQRLLLAGYKSLYVPTAVGFHEYKPFGKARHYRAKGQVKNRLRFILTHYSTRTLVLAAPALLFYEVTQALFFVLKGLGRHYFVGTLEALGALPATWRRRGEVQALRAVADPDIIFAGDIYVRPEHGAGSRVVARAVGSVSGLLAWYWRVILPFLREARVAVSRPSAKQVEE